MEYIKTVIKPFWGLLLLGGAILLVLHIFFGKKETGYGIFQSVGAVFAPVFQEEILSNDGLHMIQENVSAYVPRLYFVAGVQNVGAYLEFKDMFLVELEDGKMVSGSMEEGFVIYLMDIKNQAGDSVLLRLTTDEMAELSDWMTPFVYNQEMDCLIFNASGIYEVHIKIYGANGSSSSYTFRLPVEVG